MLIVPMAAAEASIFKNLFFLIFAVKYKAEH